MTLLAQDIILLILKIRHTSGRKKYTGHSSPFSNSWKKIEKQKTAGTLRKEESCVSHDCRTRGLPKDKNKNNTFKTTVATTKTKQQKTQNQCTRELISARGTSRKHNNKDLTAESPTVTLGLRHACIQSQTKKKRLKERRRKNRKKKKNSIRKPLGS